MLVEAHKDLAETARTRALIQAILSGPGSNEGFEATTKAFRRFTECRTPWLGQEREKLENELRRRAEEFARYVVSVSPIKEQ